MKKIILIRHAKAEKGEDIDDIDRKLSEKGIVNAKLIAKILNKKEIMFDLMISSPARRSLETAQIIATQIKYPKKNILIEPFLYEKFSIDTFLEYVKQLDDTFTTVVFFGHNPSITDLSHELDYNFSEKIPKCGVVGLSMNINKWTNVETKNKKIIFFEYPKKYK